MNIETHTITTTRWIAICCPQDIILNTGVAVLVGGEQIAVFRLPGDQVYAISNFDPYSKANVMARGLVGDRNGEVKIASPIYKNNFSLITGQALDDPAVRLRTWPARIVNGCVEIGLPKE
jgi:nitrite reductase (NADH) small subunit